MSKEQILDLLNEVAFFSDFTPEEKEGVATLEGVVVHKKRGEVVIEKGNTTPTMYFVVDGTVAITGGDNKEYEITGLEKGALFGDQRLLEVLGDVGDNSAQAALERILDAVSRHVGTARQADDLTVLVLKRIGKAAEP